MSEAPLIQPAIFLDYGADAVDGRDAACEICERGMRFKAQWRFAIGTVLHIAFTFEEDGGPHRLEAEGLVIECAPGEDNGFQTTLAFVDLPAELRTSLGKVSRRLQFQPCGSARHLPSL